MGCGRSRECILVGDGTGESTHKSSALSSSEVGLEEAEEVVDVKDSSLILVCRGRRPLSLPVSAARSTLCFRYGRTMIEPVDLEYGDSSMGVVLMREEGESKD